MAKRFGGQFSPQASEVSPANQFRGRKTYKSGSRLKFLALLTLPLCFSALFSLTAGNPAATILKLAGFAALMLAVWLTREGLQAEEAYNERKIARPPAIPRKLFGSVLSALGLGIAAFATDYGIVNSALFAIVAGVAHSVCFGFDPMRKKGMEGVNEFDVDRVARAVEKAESLVKETLAAASTLKDRQLEGRVQALANTARDMFRTVEEDPRDLTGARKFLTVYLKGARDATIKFADVYRVNPDTQTRSEYIELLNDLEVSFQDQKVHLLADNRTDLDVEIEVLRDRLKQEGVRVRR